MHNSITVCVANGEIRAPSSSVCKGEGRAMERKTVLISFMWQDGLSHPHSIINMWTIMINCVCGSLFPPCPLRCHWAGGTNSVAPWSRWMLLLPRCVSSYLEAWLPRLWRSLVWCGQRIHGQCGCFRCWLVRIVFPPWYLCCSFALQWSWPGAQGGTTLRVTWHCFAKVGLLIFWSAVFMSLLFYLFFGLWLLLIVIQLQLKWLTHTHTPIDPKTRPLLLGITSYTTIFTISKLYINLEVR